MSSSRVLCPTCSTEQERATRCMVCGGDLPAGAGGAEVVTRGNVDPEPPVESVSPSRAVSLVKPLDPSSALDLEDEGGLSGQQSAIDGLLASIATPPTVDPEAGEVESRPSAPQAAAAGRPSGSEERVAPTGKLAEPGLQGAFDSLLGGANPEDLEEGLTGAIEAKPSPSRRLPPLEEGFGSEAGAGEGYHPKHQEGSERRQRVSELLEEEGLVTDEVMDEIKASGQVLASIFAIVPLFGLFWVMRNVTLGALHRFTLLLISLAVTGATLFGMVGLLPGESDRVSRLHQQIHREITRLSGIVETHRERTGAYPTTLVWAQSIARGDVRFVDPWHRPYSYGPGADGYAIASLGSDGAPGGEGEAADVVVRFPSAPSNEGSG